MQLSMFRFSPRSYACPVRAGVVLVSMVTSVVLAGGGSGVLAQSSSPIIIAAASTVVHSPRLSPTADCVMFMVRTILLEIR